MDVCIVFLADKFRNKGCGRNNSHILKVNKNQMKQGTQKNILFMKSTYDAIFSNTFKDNIAQVPAVIDDVHVALELLIKVNNYHKTNKCTNCM